MLAGQTPNVDAVSGATYSSNGIIQAVQNALSKAGNSKTKVTKTNKQNNKTNTKTNNKTTKPVEILKPSENVTYKDGTYTAEAEGFDGLVKVTVMIKNGKITAISNTNTDTKQYFNKAWQKIQPKILQKQAVYGVDTVSGATFSSNGILQAVQKALEKAAVNTTPIPQPTAVPQPEPTTPTVKYKDGVYTGNARGYSGIVTITATVKDGKIIKGVSCEGISIGGMTRSEAKDAIESHMKEIHQEKITLYVDDERSSAKIEDLGAFAEADKTVEEAYALGRSGSIFTKYSDVKEKKHKLPVYRKYDKAKFEKNVKKATKKIVSEPRNASVKRKAGKFVVIKEKTGYTLNMNETFANFKKAVEAGKHQFELDVVKKKAKYTSKDMAEIKDVLGTYTTEYGGSPYGRKVNVANGASKINGSMVYPGETLSVYKTVSPFTKENGYALAGSYENGQTVQTYGGGICQVSTTLYNAVIRAELKIVERFPHSMTVHYVPRSADAAIAGTHKDMKFKNTFDTPIYIEGKANGSTITFTIYGKKKDSKRTVEFLSETTQVKESSESTVSDNTLAEGQKVVESYGHTGYSARLWKIVKINGKQVSKKVFNTSTYMSTPTVYRVGTKKAEDKKDDKKDKKKDSKETTAQKSETTTAAQKSTTAAQKSTTAKRSAAVKSQGSTGN